MFALIRFDNGHLAIYPKEVVKKFKDYVVVKVKGCYYNASLLHEDGRFELLESIKQDIEKKRLYISLPIDLSLREGSPTSGGTKNDDNIKLLNQVGKHIENKQSSPFEENLPDNTTRPSPEQTLANPDTYAMPVSEGFALAHNSDCTSPNDSALALDTLPGNPHISATGQEDIWTSSADCSKIISNFTGKSRRRLFQETPVANTVDNIELLKNVAIKNKHPSYGEEHLPQNMAHPSFKQKLRCDNFDTNVTPVRQGIISRCNSDSISQSGPASELDICLLPEGPNSLSADQEDVVTSTESSDIISRSKGNSSKRRLLESIPVQHTMVFGTDVFDPASVPSVEDMSTSKPDFTSAISQSVVQRPKKPCKQHSCYFCGLLFTNLRKHWRRKHKDEPMFQEALKNIGSKKQHRAFEKLRKLGDEKYNNSRECTKLITVRDSSAKAQSNYLLCVECHGYYVSKNYARHRKLYCSKTAEFGYGLLGKARVATSRISQDAHPLLVREIFPYLTKEKQRDVILKDPAAIIMGNILSEEQLSKPDPGDLYKYVSNQLRLLADIFNIANSLDPEISEIDDLFYAHRYETVVKAIQARGNFKHGIYKTPYPAMTSCTILSKLCRKLKSIALSMNNDVDYKRYDQFGSLLKEQQNTNVTKLASAAVIAHRRRKVDVIPSTSEVNVLFQTLLQECKTAFEAAKSNLTVQSYSRLAKAVVARITVMNRRRPGDVHRTTLEEYSNLTGAEKGFLSNLSDSTERNMAANLFRYVTKGKLNKNIANLITTDMVEAINFLIEHRREVGISDEDKYVFANPKAKRAPFFRADDALKSICDNFGLAYDKLSATKLRKHFATTTANMDQNTQMLISDFMGHSYNIHQNVYQIRQVQTDVSVMGRILYDASGVYCTDKPLTTPITSGDVSSSLQKPSWLDDGCDTDDDIINNEKPEVPSAMSRWVSNSDVSGSKNQRRTREAPTTFTKETESEATTNKHVKQIHKKQKTHDLPRLDDGCDIDANYDDTNGGEHEIPGTLSDYRTSGSDKVSVGPYMGAKSRAASNTSAKHIHKQNIYKLPFSISSYKMSNFRAPFISRTWRTPDKKNARTVFQEYIKNEDVPSLSEIQEILAKQPVTFSKRISQIQSWIRAEIQRNKRAKGEYTKERWATPQKTQLRRHFHEYYRITKETGKMSYPSSAELHQAIQNVPELKNKKPALLRSKLQNEYKNLFAIKVFSDTSEDDSNETESEEEY